MRIAIFSDIHGNLQALETILNDIKENNIDKIYFLGDAIAIGPNSKDCLDLIIENNIKMVLGNHELYYLKEIALEGEMSEGEILHQQWVRENLNQKHKDFLSKCPLKIEENINNKKIIFEHFLLNDNLYPFEHYKISNDEHLILEKLKLLNADFIFIGHEHNEFKIEEDNKMIIDVGSSGCTKDNKTFYTILELEDNNVNIEKKVITYDRSKFEETMKNIEYPEKEFISKIFFGIN